jgi:ParB/RepB/Spo0J family partition protein
VFIMKELSQADTVLELDLGEIGHSYAHLRLIHPQSDAAMVESIRKYGQLSPVVVGLSPAGRYELVDGFKRLRACQKLGIQTLKATVLDVGVHALKAAMVQLNWKARTMAQLEEAMVVHSLWHEDGLTQVEIAALLGRHKSWVCRRISLIEHLCDEALGLIRVGLLSATQGRELARLPRGNQPAALGTIQKYRLSSRETTRLVSILLERPRWEHQIVLNFPQEILDDRSPQRPRNSRLSRAGQPLQAKLVAIEHNTQRVLKALSTTVLPKEDRRQMLCVVQSIEHPLNQMKTLLS